MEVQILVNCALGETRIALLEDGEVREFYVERDHARAVVGNIYRGRVSRVLPGMQAAFVQIGLERAAFLYVDDVVQDDEPQTEDDDLDEDEPPKPPDRPRRSIAELLREGQEITVQVAKAPLGTKGARVTTYITIPGRYVVYMPTMNRIGVSRRITQETERRQLRETIQAHRKPDDGGFIARTVCAGLEASEIAKDMEFVRGLWRNIEGRAQTAVVPSLVQADLDLALRAARDLFNDDVTKMIIDDREQAERVEQLLAQSAPHLADRVEVYEEPIPLFDRFGVEPVLDQVLLREIHLRSGASIVVDEAEALTAIDVNTGRFVGTHDLEATILKTNLEATKEIATQIRLRNLGGIIIVDFIDMQQPESREQVHKAFLEELNRDRAKTHALEMSGLGLLEMTRKRVRPSLGKTLTEPCPYCDGRGRIRSRQTVGYEILREVERRARIHPGGTILVSAMPEVAIFLSEEEQEHVMALEKRIGRTIIVEARGDLHQEVYQVSVRSAE